MKASEKKESPLSSHGLGAVKRMGKPHHSSFKSQRQRLLQYLHTNGSVTTLEARETLNIQCPAPRVHELRHKMGFPIVTHNVWGVSEYGTSHLVARYSLATADEPTPDGAQP